MPGLLRPTLALPAPAGSPSRDLLAAIMRSFEPAVPSAPVRRRRSRRPGRKP